MTTDHKTPALAEADRLMTVCNACRYCEGLCAVFPAMEERRAFTDGDLDYLANLCHGCGACFADCQFAPPHEFNVNVPRALATVRWESWSRYAWPTASAFLSRSSHLGVYLVVGFAFMAWPLIRSGGVANIFRVETGPGAFFRVMPHEGMVAVFGVLFGLAVLGLCVSVGRFWRAMGPLASPLAIGDVGRGLIDAFSLTYLGGGGAGCGSEPDGPPDHRRLYHHLTAYGFLLCFAATCVATLYHFVLGRPAPYDLWEPPVVLGTLGGLGMVIGPVGLYAERRKRDPATLEPARARAELGFLALILVTALTGLVLLAVRSSNLMPLALAVHLATVIAFFLMITRSKLVHGAYRLAALIRYAIERRTAK